MAIEEFAVNLSANFAQFEKKIAEAAESVGKIGDVALIVAAKLDKVADALDTSINKLAHSTNKIGQASRRTSKELSRTSASARDAQSKTEGFLSTIKELTWNLLKTGGVVFGIGLLSLKLAGFNVTIKNLGLVTKSFTNIFAAIAPRVLGKFANQLQILVGSGTNLASVFFKLETTFQELIGRLAGARGIALFEKFGFAMKRASAAAKDMAAKAAPAFFRVRESTKGFGEAAAGAGKAASDLGGKVGEAGRKFHEAAEGQALFMGNLGKMGVKGGLAAGIATFFGQLIGGLDSIAAKMLGLGATGGFGMLILIATLTSIIGDLSLAIGRTLLGALEKATAEFTLAQQEMFRFKAAVIGLNAAIGVGAGGLKEWTKFIDDIAASTAVARAQLLGAAGLMIEVSRNVGLTADQMKVLFKRTVDLSEASGRPLQQAIRSISTALLGNVTAAKALGVTLNQSIIRESEYFKALNKTWVQLTLNEKVQLRFAVLMEQSEAFMGSAVKRTDEWVGAIQRLTNQWQLWNQAWGKTIADLLLPFVQQLNKLVASMLASNSVLRGFTALLAGVTGVAFVLLGHFAKWSALIIGVIFGVKALSLVVSILTKGQVNLAGAMRKATFAMAGVNKKVGLARAIFTLFLVTIRDTFKAMGLIIKRVFIFAATGGILTSALTKMSKAIFGMSFSLKAIGRRILSVRISFVLLIKTLQNVVKFMGKVVFVNFMLIATKGVLVAAIIAVVAVFIDLVKILFGAQKGAEGLAKKAGIVTKALLTLKKAGSILWSTFKRIELVLSAVTQILKTGILFSLLAVGVVFRSLVRFLTTTLREQFPALERAIVSVTSTLKIMTDTVLGFFSNIGTALQRTSNFLIKTGTDLQILAKELKASADIADRVLGAAIESAALAYLKLGQAIDFTTKAVVKSAEETKIAAATMKKGFAGLKAGFDEAKDGFIKGMVEWKQEYEQRANDFIQIARDTADAMSNSFSDLFFDTMTGRFSDLREAARSTFRAIARSISDALGRKLTSELIQISGPATTKLRGIPGLLGLGRKKEGVPAVKVKDTAVSGFTAELTTSSTVLKIVTDEVSELGTAALETAMGIKNFGDRLGGLFEQQTQKFEKAFFGPKETKRGLEEVLGGRTTLGREGGFRTGAENRAKFLDSLKEAEKASSEELREAQDKNTSSLRESTSATGSFIGSLSGIFGKIGGFLGGAGGGLASTITKAATGGGGFLGGALGFASKIFGFQHGGVANLSGIGSAAQIAKSPTIATISEKEPEIISPLSKLEDLIKPVQINVQAIDAKSAAQWFRDNKEIVMGTLFSNRSTATKNLSPVSRGPF